MCVIKLVATDMDGTLLNDKKELPKDFCSFAASHKDIKMVIASGRQYFNLIKTFPNNVNDFIFIADNGAVVFEKGKPLFIDSIDMDVVEELLKEIHKIEGVACVLCGAKSAYISTVDDIALKNIQMYYAKVKFEMKSIDQIEDDNILKIAVFLNKEAETKLYPAIAHLNNPDGRLSAVLSGDSWVDIMNRETNKGTALKKIMDIYGIKPEESMAFGDYHNDLEMIKVCKESYAMENAHDDIKAAAKYIAPSNNDEGVMKVLLERIK